MNSFEDWCNRHEVSNMEKRFMEKAWNAATDEAVRRIKFQGLYNDEVSAIRTAAKVEEIKA